MNKAANVLLIAASFSKTIQTKKKKTKFSTPGLKENLKFKEKTEKITLGGVCCVECSVGGQKGGKIFSFKAAETPLMIAWCC